MLDLALEVSGLLLELDHWTTVTQLSNVRWLALLSTHPLCVQSRAPDTGVPKYLPT